MSAIIPLDEHVHICCGRVVVGVKLSLITPTLSFRNTVYSVQSRKKKVSGARRGGETSVGRVVTAAFLFNTQTKKKNILHADISTAFISVLVRG